MDKETQFKGCQLAGELVPGGYPTHGRPMAVEPKFDGYRLNAMVDEAGEVTMYCRSGPPVCRDVKGRWAVDFLKEQVKALNLVGPVMLDGEVAGRTWGETGLLRQMNPDPVKLREAITFHVFDLVPMEKVDSFVLPRCRKPTLVVRVPAYARRQLLCELRPLLSKYAPNVKIAEQVLALNEEAFQAELAKLVASGFEGAMLKDSGAPYFFGRTEAWLKAKVSKTRELVVIKGVEGGGEDAGMLGSLLCEDPETKERISVSSGLWRALQIELWAERDALPGREVEVKVNVCDGTWNRHPVFLRFRVEKEGR